MTQKSMNKSASTMMTYNNICKENKIKSVIFDGRKYKCADNVSDAMKRGNTLTKIKIKK